MSRCAAPGFFVYSNSGGQLYSGGELAVHGPCRRGSVQLCGRSVLQPHKAHRTRARPKKQAHQKVKRFGKEDEPHPFAIPLLQDYSFAP
jgi:hypothetical protein